jgi:glycosyltransferase involved in cell wall biosynthesis
MCAGNKLSYRLPAGEFLTHLGDFLQQHPKAYFLAMGRGDLNKTLDPLKERGLGDRCLTVGPNPNIRPVLKAIDIFLNEYPEGGCNTVMEAMACGKPAMAMHAGAQHTHNHGAMLLGEPWAVMEYDPQTYWQRVGEWVEDADARRQAGEAQRQKCVEQFDYPILCRGYESRYLEMLEA